MQQPFDEIQRKEVHFHPIDPYGRLVLLDLDWRGEGGGDELGRSCQQSSLSSN